MGEGGGIVRKARTVTIPQNYDAICFKYGESEIQTVLKKLEAMTEGKLAAPRVSPNRPRDDWCTCDRFEIGKIIRRSIVVEYRPQDGAFRLWASCYLYTKPSATRIRKAFVASADGFREACEWLTGEQEKLITEYCL